jgi:DNA-dependent RNA polymerase auxiliary subunit epsilon
VIGRANSEKRISVTGFIVYLLNLPVCWRSKAQRGVVLSSIKAENVAISEAANEIKFIYHIDTRYVRENLEEGTVNIEFVESIENDFDKESQPGNLRQTRDEIPRGTR